ncbi:hypothetical protein B0A55_05855 [Friedmanniomyces simplex]|uniref:Uncharacterized protein n=1 Tax=Friedmanniomyces simplex TaxID=329884 RepID=A0A4U0X7A7_9PEZI|nr:hypothetical protein B0A55_05855 [Friedmanniomyces simplex]
MSDLPPRDDDHDDDFDAGPAFTHGSGIMGPPMQPGAFDAEMARDMTPPARGYEEPPIPPGVGENPHNAPFSDDLYDEITRERASPPSPMSPHGGGQEFAAEFGPPGPMLGQHPEGQTPRSMEGMPAPGYGQGQAPANAPLGYGHGQASADAPPGNVPEGADEEMEEDLYGMSGSPSSGSSGYSSGWSVE